MNALLQIFIALLCGGAFLFGASQWPVDMQRLKNGADSMHWPVAQATIKTGRVDIQKHYRKASEYETFQWFVTYDYNVGGKAYTGSRISFATAADHASENAVIVDKIRERFAVGSKHPVRYNPKNPAEAVLIPGVAPEQTSLDSYLWMVGSIMFFATAVLRIGYDRRTGTEGIVAAVVLVGFIGLGIFAQPFVVKMLVPPDTVIAALR